VINRKLWLLQTETAKFPFSLQTQTLIRWRTLTYVSHVRAYKHTYLLLRRQNNKKRRYTPDTHCRRCVIKASIIPMLFLQFLLTS